MQQYQAVVQQEQRVQYLRFQVLQVQLEQLEIQVQLEQQVYQPFQVLPVRQAQV